MRYCYEAMAVLSFVKSSPLWLDGSSSNLCGALMGLFFHFVSIERPLAEAESRTMDPHRPITIHACSHRMNRAGPPRPIIWARDRKPRGLREWWVRFWKDKVENPLFSGTWWLRLCNFALFDAPINADGAPEGRRINILACYPYRGIAIRLAVFANYQYQPIEV